MRRPTRIPLRRGFTLTELVIVLAITGILASIAIPRLGASLARHRADQAAARIVADVNLARRNARLSSAERTISFNASSFTYTISDLVNPDHPDQPYTVYLAAEPYNVTLLTADFGSTTGVTFDGYGKPDTGGSAYVGVGDTYRKIAINDVTGEPTVSEVSVVIVAEPAGGGPVGAASLPISMD